MIFFNNINANTVSKLCTCIIYSLNFKCKNKIKVGIYLHTFKFCIKHFYSHQSFAREVAFNILHKAQKLLGDSFVNSCKTTSVYRPVYNLHSSQLIACICQFHTLFILILYTLFILILYTHTLLNITFFKILIHHIFLCP